MASPPGICLAEQSSAGHGIKEWCLPIYGRQFSETRGEVRLESPTCFAAPERGNSRQIRETIGARPCAPATQGYRLHARRSAGKADVSGQARSGYCGFYFWPADSMSRQVNFTITHRITRGPPICQAIWSPFFNFLKKSCERTASSQLY